jgi:hypothetical protein
MASLDDACVELVALAKRLGVDTIDVCVRQDGRVYIWGRNGGICKFDARGDVHPGGALQWPSAALADVKNDRETGT